MDVRHPCSDPGVRRVRAADSLLSTVLFLLLRTRAVSLGAAAELAQRQSPACFQHIRVEMMGAAATASNGLHRTSTYGKPESYNWQTQRTGLRGRDVLPLRWFLASSLYTCVWQQLTCMEQAANVTDPLVPSSNTFSVLGLESRTPIVSGLQGGRHHTRQTVRPSFQLVPALASIMTGPRASATSVNNRDGFAKLIPVRTHKRRQTGKRSHAHRHTDTSTRLEGARIFPDPRRKLSAVAKQKSLPPPPQGGSCPPTPYTAHRTPHTAHRNRRQPVEVRAKGAQGASKAPTPTPILFRSEPRQLPLYGQLVRLASTTSILARVH